MAQRVEIVAGDNDQTALFPTAASLTNPAQTYVSNSYDRLTDSKTVKTGPGTFGNINVSAAGTTITINAYDGTSAAGTLMFGPYVLVAGASLQFNQAFAVGLHFTFSGTTGTPSINVGYR